MSGLASVCGLLAGLIAIETIGAALLHLTRSPAAGDGLVGRAAWAFLLGSGAVAGSGVLLTVAHLPASAVVTLPAWLAGCWWLLRRRRAHARGQWPAQLRQLAREIWQQAARSTALEKSMVAIILANIAVTVVGALAVPMRAWDSVTIWGFKAALLHHDGTIYTPAFFDSAVFHLRPRYPILVPQLLRTFYDLMGGVDDQPVKVVFAVFFAAMLTIVFARLRTELGRPVSLACVAMLACAPAYATAEEGVIGGHATIVLTCYFLAALLELERWLRTDARSAAVTAGLFLGLVVLTKAEGQALALLLAALALGLGWLPARTNRRLAGVIALAATSAIISVPWLAVRAALPDRHDEGYLAALLGRGLVAGVARLPIILTGLAQELVNLQHWHLLWIGAAVIVAAKFWRAPNRAAALFGVAAVAQLVIFIAAFMLTPYPVVSHIHEALWRLLTQVAPVAVMAAGLLLRSNRVATARG